MQKRENGCVRFNWYLMQCTISERCIYFDEFGSVGTARGYPRVHVDL